MPSYPSSTIQFGQRPILLQAINAIRLYQSKYMVHELLLALSSRQTNSLNKNLIKAGILFVPFLPGIPRFFASSTTALAIEHTPWQSRACGTKDAALTLNLNLGVT
jgi:hypothetical protein